MTEDEIRRIAREGAREGVREAFMHFGIDLADARSLSGLQADLQFLARQRKGAEEAGRWIRRGVLGAFLSGVVWLVVEGIKQSTK